MCEVDVELRDRLVVHAARQEALNLRLIRVHLIRLQKSNVTPILPTFMQKPGRATILIRELCEFAISFSDFMRRYVDICVLMMEPLPDIVTLIRQAVDKLFHAELKARGRVRLKSLCQFICHLASSGLYDSEEAERKYSEASRARWDGGMQSSSAGLVAVPTSNANTERRSVTVDDSPVVPMRSITIPPMPMDLLPLPTNDDPSSDDEFWLLPPPPSKAPPTPPRANPDRTSENSPTSKDTCPTLVTPLTFDAPSPYENSENSPTSKDTCPTLVTPLACDAPSLYENNENSPTSKDMCPTLVTPLSRDAPSLYENSEYSPTSKDPCPTLVIPLARDMRTVVEQASTCAPLGWRADCPSLSSKSIHPRAYCPRADFPRASESLSAEFPVLRSDRIVSRKPMGAWAKLAAINVLGAYGIKTKRAFREVSVSNSAASSSVQSQTVKATGSRRSKADPDGSECRATACVTEEIKGCSASLPGEHSISEGEQADVREQGAVEQADVRCLGPEHSISDGEHAEIVSELEGVAESDRESMVRRTVSPPDNAYEEREPTIEGCMNLDALGEQWSKWESVMRCVSARSVGSTMECGEFVVANVSELDACACENAMPVDADSSDSDVDSYVSEEIGIPRETLLMYRHVAPQEPDMPILVAREVATLKIKMRRNVAAARFPRRSASAYESPTFVPNFLERNSSAYDADFPHRQVSHTSTSLEESVQVCTGQRNSSDVMAQARPRPTWASRAEDIDEISRALKLILNKLTPEKFDVLLEQLMSLGIANKGHMETLAKGIFEKVTAEHLYVNMYSMLCTRLLEWFAGRDDCQHKLFLRSLVDQCQIAFESYDTECGMGETEKDYERYVKVKNKMMGNLKFIGELLCRQIIRPKIIEHCISALTKSSSDIAIEGLVVFLATVGPVFETLEHSDNASWILAETFAALTVAVNKQQCRWSTRMKYLVKDLLERRSSTVLKPQEMPATLGDIRRQWESDYFARVTN